MDGHAASSRMTLLPFVTTRPDQLDDRARLFVPHASSRRPPIRELGPAQPASSASNVTIEISVPMSVRSQPQS